VEVQRGEVVELPEAEELEAAVVGEVLVAPRAVLEQLLPVAERLLRLRLRAVLLVVELPAAVVAERGVAVAEPEAAEHRVSRGNPACPQTRPSNR